MGTSQRTLQPYSAPGGTGTIGQPWSYPAPGAPFPAVGPPRLGRILPDAPRGGSPPPDVRTQPYTPSPGFFDLGQTFLGGLLRGEVPESMRAQAARGLEESQRALNAELQKRGAYFSTPGLQMQQRLAENYGTNLSALMAERAMQAIPQGLGLYSTGWQLGQGASDVPPWFSSALQLLGGLRGQAVMPQYTQDPWGGILGSLLGMFLG